jgi:hypothetical protein
MDAKGSVGGRAPGGHLELDAVEREGPAWTIGRLIELVDDAIDTAGAQLARSAGLWADSPGAAPVAQSLPRRVRRTGRRRLGADRHADAESLIDDATGDRELELP